MRAAPGLWSIDQFQVARNELDFSSTSGGKPVVSAIVCDGTQLCNALEFVSLEKGGLAQVRVCECCGHPHCESGGWVALRRLGESVLWLPAWSEMEAGGWEAGEYCPPPFMESRGAPCFSAPGWKRIRELNASLPIIPDLEPINLHECVRWVQLTAPGGVLGKFPQPPRLRRDLLLAVGHGDLEAEAEFTDRVLDRGLRDRLPVVLVPSGDELEPVEFALDLPAVPLWSGVARSRAGACILPAPGIVLRPQA